MSNIEHSCANFLVAESEFFGFFFSHAYPFLGSFPLSFEANVLDKTLICFTCIIPSSDFEIDCTVIVSICKG